AQGRGPLSGRGRPGPSRRPPPLIQSLAMTRTHDGSRESGRTLMEVVVVAALVAVGLAIAVPQLKAYAVESHLMGAARQFKGTFPLARSTAIRLGVYTAIRFERAGTVWRYSVYADGDSDGVQ